jgi:hypothetical protein
MTQCAVVGAAVTDPPNDEVDFSVGEEDETSDDDDDGDSGRETSRRVSMICVVTQCEGISTAYNDNSGNWAHTISFFGTRATFSINAEFMNLFHESAFHEVLGHAVRYILILFSSSSLHAL